MDKGRLELSGTGTVHAPIGVGELIDKITILEIKSAHAREPDAAANIARELAELTKLVQQSWAPVLAELKPELARVNRQIWDVEEEIRNKHANGEYDQRFVELAVLVFVHNDRRSVIKRDINERLGSDIVEEKIYTHMTGAGQS